MQPAAQREPVVAACSPAAGGAESLDFGLAISRLSGAPLIVVAVTADGAAGRRPAGAAWRLRRALERREIRPADVRVVEADTPARGLARALDELAPALIALAPRRDARPAGRLGTTTRRVMHVSSCPVALVPAGYRPPPGGLRVIGAAYAPTDEGDRALRAAAALASAAGAQLRAVAAIDGPDQRADGILRHARSALPTGMAVELDVHAGDPADGLVRASRGLDLLVLGSRASGPPGVVRLGSVSRAVVDRAACPVLLLPRLPATASSPRSDDAPGPLPVDLGASPAKEER
jgi:nucleotide-binding universal stress UspA family protein